MLRVLKKIPKKVYMIVTKPERFFKRIVVDGSFNESIIKAFLYGLIGGIALLVMTMIGGAAITPAAFFSKLLIYPLVAVCVLFAFAGVMMLFSEITFGARDWELAVKGTSSIFFMYPVMLVLNALAFDCISLLVINILIDAYVLFLLYNVAYHCMGGRRRAVLVVIACVAVIVAVVYASDIGRIWLVVKNPAVGVGCL